MKRPTKPMPPPPAGGSKPWQMFPPVVTTSRRSPITSTDYAPSPRPPAPPQRGDSSAPGEAVSGDAELERPAMSAPGAAGTARDA